MNRVNLFPPRIGFAVFCAYAAATMTAGSACSSGGTLSAAAVALRAEAGIRPEGDAAACRAGPHYCRGPADPRTRGLGLVH